MEDDTDPTPRPESLLPYDSWAEEALRQVVVRALSFAAKNGLPGEHHFYVSFRTDHPDVSMPPRLKAQYPREMTVVLQHQFWELKTDETPGSEHFQVGLSFGGVPSTLRVPYAAVTAFADPHVQFGLRFQAEEPQAANEPEAAALPAPAPQPAGSAAGGEDKPDEAPAPQVVSLDAFRRRAPKE